MAGINKLKTKIAKNGFVVNSAQVLSGTVISQAIPIIFYPILGRLFSPSEFGILASFTSVVAILTVIANGQYQYSVLLAPSRRDAFNIIVISLCLALLFLFFTQIIFYIWAGEIAFILNESNLKVWLNLAPISAFSIIIYNNYNEWCVRNKTFNILSINKVFNSSSHVGVKSIFGFSGFTSGLILGDVIGRLLSSFLCIFSFFKRDSMIVKSFSYKRSLLLLKQYNNCPKYLLPGQLINVLASSVPLLLLLKYFSKEEVGYFSMALTVLFIPVSVISLALKDVFRQRANSDFNELGNCRHIYAKTFKYLFLLSIPLFTIFCFIAPYLFKLVLGNQWGEAGYYAQILTPMVAISFISEVFASVSIIANKMKFVLFWQILYAFVNIISIIIGAVIFKSIVMALIFYSLGRVFMYSLNMIYTYKFAKGITLINHHG